MQRSKSTPNVRALPDVEGSITDKKRNKLGYHRTAVACGHCRRRKIRCVLAGDDATARCQNCIRLKKDCHFYPVDQQPHLVKRTRSGTKVEVAMNDPETSISSPSPGLPGTLGDQVDDYHGNQVDALSLSQEDAQFHSGILPDRGILLSNDHEYTHEHSIHLLNPASFISQSSPTYDRQRFEAHAAFWQSGQQPSPAYSNIPMTPLSATLAHTSQENAQPYAIAASRPDLSWQQPHAPIRSMSVSGPTDHQYLRFYEELTPGIRRSATSSSDMHQIAAGFTINNAGGQNPQPHAQANVLPFDEQQQSHLGQHGYPGPWHSFPGSQNSQLASPEHSHSSHGWYAPSQGLHNLVEEDLYQRSQPS